jgi:uncharacterized alpha-E superfamily protein
MAESSLAKLIDGLPIWIRVPLAIIVCLLVLAGALSIYRGRGSTVGYLFSIEPYMTMQAANCKSLLRQLAKTETNFNGQMDDLQAEYRKEMDIAEQQDELITETRQDVAVATQHAKNATQARLDASATIKTIREAVGTFSGNIEAARADCTLK